MLHTRKQKLFGIEIDALTMDEAIDHLHEWMAAAESKCRYVVTPNVDHAVMLQHRNDLRLAYADATLVLPDGHPLVWASRLLGRNLPERVPGSDLVPRFFDSCQARQRPLDVFLLGAAAGVGDRAALRIQREWSTVRVVGVCSPPIGFERDDRENDAILSQIRTAQPDLVIVGLGAPKQELWVHRHREQLCAKAALCVGATIDFLAGEKRRAPRWMQRVGLEWFHRMASEPRRLIRRYAKDAWVFPQLVWQQWWQDLGRVRSPVGPPR